LSTTCDTIHPELQAAMDAVDLPEVQEMMQRLASHGLAVALPHMHKDDGKFVPLPADTVAVEAGLQVSFSAVTDSVLEDGVPVMWRWDGGKKTAAKCSWCLPKGPKGCH
jgi:hypothetical protein